MGYTYTKILLVFQNLNFSKHPVSLCVISGSHKLYQRGLGIYCFMPLPQQPRENTDEMGQRDLGAAYAEC